MDIFCLKVYRMLGGNKHGLFAYFSVFIFAGFVLHDLPVYLIAGKLYLTTSFSFIFFACFSILTQSVERRYRLFKRRGLTQVILNLSLVVSGFVLGTVINQAIFVS